MINFNLQRMVLLFTISLILPPMVQSSSQAYASSPARWAFNALDTRYFFKPQFYCIGQNGAVLSGDMAQKCCNYEDSATGSNWPSPKSGQNAYTTEAGCPTLSENIILSELAPSVAFDNPSNQAPGTYLNTVGGGGGGVLGISATVGSKAPTDSGLGKEGGGRTTSGPSRSAAVADLSTPGSTTGSGNTQTGIGGNIPSGTGSEINPASSGGSGGTGGGGGGSAGGGGGGSLGAGSTSTQATGNGQVGSPTQAAAIDSGGSTYGGGGGGGGGGRGGGGSEGPDLFGAFGSLFGKKDGGSGPGGPGGEVQFGARTPSSARTPQAAATAAGSENDPADYFDRSTVDDDLFKIIEGKYRQKTPALGSSSGASPLQSQQVQPQQGQTPPINKPQTK